VKTSDTGLQLIKDSEGFSSIAYRHANDVWTIGYGHTSGVQRGDKVTPDQADELLRKDVSSAEWAVMKLVYAAMTQGMFDALVDFVFNLGEGAFADSTLLRKLNSGDLEGAAEEFPRWVHDASGAVLPGLVTRRQREQEMFLGKVNA